MAVYSPCSKVLSLPFRIVSSFGSDEKQWRGCPLPARPSPRCETGHMQEGYVNIPLSRLFSGILVCCKIVFPLTQRRISETFTHTIQRRVWKTFVSLQGQKKIKELLFREEHPHSEPGVMHCLLPQESCHRSLRQRVLLSSGLSLR